MREIKFRAWDKDLQRFRHIDHIIFDWDGNPWRIFVNAPNEVGCILFMYEIDLQQFTGLLDKNGKEIYEGDIVECLVKTIEQKEEEIQQYSVQYESGLAAWLLFPLGLCSKGEFLYSTGADILEVIGNIYEAKKEKG